MTFFGELNERPTHNQHGYLRRVRLRVVHPHGLTANHPRVQYLVVDNTPDRDPRTEAITRASGGTYLHRPDLSGTSKPRDAVFRFAQTPWVMCIDSHVILETGAVAAALWGTWDRMEMKAEGGRQEGGKTSIDSPFRLPPSAFEIPMMGLGLWMMRKEAWPGFNPLFRGFGGEEGYTHETVRRRGGKCFCLPALRWRHKFRDVSGWSKNPAPPYPLRLEDHVWNLLVGHRELGIDAVAQIYDHFGKRLDKVTWDRLVAESKAQPFGGPRPEVKRQKILALWYSDNRIPKQLLERSSMTVAHAAARSLRHDVTVSACAWHKIPGVRFGHFFTEYAGEKRRGYDTIVNQIKQAIAAALHREGLELGVRGEGREKHPRLLSPLP
jgi:hypothetical protein